MFYLTERSTSLVFNLSDISIDLLQATFLPIELNFTTKKKDKAHTIKQPL